MAQHSQLNSTCALNGLIPVHLKLSPSPHVLQVKHSVANPQLSFIVLPFQLTLHCISIYELLSNPPSLLVRSLLSFATCTYKEKWKEWQ